MTGNKCVGPVKIDDFFHSGQKTKYFFGPNISERFIETSSTPSTRY